MTRKLENVKSNIKHSSETNDLCIYDFVSLYLFLAPMEILASIRL